MIVTNKINVYIHQNAEYSVDAVQGDTARVLELALYAGASEWPVPAGAVVQVRFRKPDGTGGYYDTLPEGTCAYKIQDNRVTVVLAPQVLTVAGEVEAQILLCWSEGELATFTLRIRVQADPSLGTLDSEDYVNLSSWVANRVKNYLEEAQEELRELYAIPGAFVVHVHKSGGKYTADKTYDEILAAGPTWVKAAPEDGRPVFCVLWWPSGREYAVLTLAAHDPAASRLTFSGMEGNGQYWVTISAEGVGAGWTQMARSEDIPKSLPNPCALTVGSQSYDGSEAVTLELGPVTVGFDWDGILANKELAELYGAYQAGRPVYFLWEGCLLPTVSATDKSWLFSGICDGKARQIELGLNEDGYTVVTAQHEQELGEKVSIGGNGNWFIGGVDTGVKAAGEDGRSIHSIELDASQSDETQSVYTICDDGDAPIGSFTVYHGKDADSTPLIVTGADISLADLYAAHQAGRTVYFQWQNYLVPTVAAMETAWLFEGMADLQLLRVALGLDGDGNTVVTEQKSWDVARKTDIPARLANPHALTVNGVAYDGSAAVEVTLPQTGSYRLIEKRELSEGTESIVTFSDLDLTAFRAYLSVPQGTAAVSVGAAAYIGSTLVGYAWLATMISATSSRVAMVEGKHEGGLVTYRNTTPANTTSNTQVYSQSPVCAEATGPFSKLEFAAGSAGVFPAGTVIQLWGIES